MIRYMMNYLEETGDSIWAFAVRKGAFVADCYRLEMSESLKGICNNRDHHNEPQDTVVRGSLWWGVGSSQTAGTTLY